jgi:hypothetical protein
VRRLVPKLNMRPERRPLQVGVPQGGACERVRARGSQGLQGVYTPVTLSAGGFRPSRSSWLVV